jgi:integrase
VKRVRRKAAIGSKADCPTRKLAARAFAERITYVNKIGYSPMPTARLRNFAESWETKVLSQYERSTAITYRTHVRKHLVPFFGEYAMRDINSELVQQFVCRSASGPKTLRNIVITLRAMWTTAKAWGYVAHDITQGVVLPHAKRRQRFFASPQQIQLIIASAEEPLRTFCGLAGETGLRPGELCGLTVDDLDLEHGVLQVRQSAWRGILGNPKTADSVRVVELSPQACIHLKVLASWNPNDRRLLFATRNGTPCDQNLLLKRKFKPLPSKLGISLPRGDGFYILRHGNATMMSRFGTPQKLRQQRLGHADGSPITESVYTHVVSEDGKRVAAQLGETVWGILDPIRPKKENGLGVEPPKPLFLN